MYINVFICYLPFAILTFGVGLSVGTILSFTVVGKDTGAPIINIGFNFQMCLMNNILVFIICTHIVLFVLIYSNYKPSHPIVVGIRLQYSVTSSPATQAKHSAVSALQHGSAFTLTFSFLSEILLFLKADTLKHITYEL